MSRARSAWSARGWRASAPRAAAGFLLALPVVLLALLAWSRRWTSEEGFLLYRIVGNLAEGDGPVFNVGERVEAYDGPLWLALLALGRAIVPKAVHLEWIGVGFGLTLSAAALACAGAGALRLWSPAGWPHPVLPLGALTVAVLPPFWDGASSGLETGLALFWLASAFLGLTTLALGPDGRPRAGARGGEPTEHTGWRTGTTFLDGLRSPPVLALTIGLGPLVRLDLTPLALAFLLLLVALGRPRALRYAIALAGCAATLPLLYQVFRMGYFASLGPSTAPAGESGAPPGFEGWRELSHLLFTYVLWLPLLVLLGWAAVAARGLWRRGDRDRALLLAVPIAGGLGQALLVVAFNAGAVQARSLLPSVFAVLMPVAVGTPARRGSAVALSVLVLAWAIVCATSLRAPLSAPGDRQPARGDERARYAAAGYRHPVTLDGLLAVPESRPAIERRQGLELSRLARRRRAIVLTYSGARNKAGERLKVPRPHPQAAPRSTVSGEVVARSESIGRVGYAAGASVLLVDAHGDADALGARARTDGASPLRPREMPAAWVLARYASTLVPGGAAGLERDPQVAAARRALACPPLRELVDATSADLTLVRFVSNAGYAVRERSLRFSSDPLRAARETCRGAG